MVNNIEIQGVKMDVDAKLQAYITKKIGRLDRFVSRHARQSMQVKVFLKEQKKKTTKDNICEVVIKLPKDTITVEEATINMYAAVDIVETKLKNLLKKYKDTHSHKRFHHRVFARIKRAN